eukprot:183296-Rhodomonas_salina.1
MQAPARLCTTYCVCCYRAMLVVCNALYYLSVLCYLPMRYPGTVGDKRAVVPGPVLRERGQAPTGTAKAGDRARGGPTEISDAVLGEQEWEAGQSGGCTVGASLATARQSQRARHRRWPTRWRGEHADWP